MAQESNHGHSSLGAAGMSASSVDERAPPRTSNGNDKSNEPSSWGGLLTSYCEERSGPGPPRVDVYRFTRQRGNMIKEQERAFNPITQTHLDPKKEEAVKQKEGDVMIADINKGMKKALTTDSYVGYDLLNQKPKFGIDGIENMGYREMARGRRTLGVKPPSTNVDYDIVTLQGEPPPPHKPRDPRQGTRDYNILTHLHKLNHAQKVQRDRQRVRENYARLKGKAYDPILARLNDVDKELKIREQMRADGERKKQELHCTTAKTPIPIRKSEGHNYDIVIGTTHSIRGTDTLDRKNRVGIAPRMQLRAKIAQQIRTQDAVLEKRDVMAVNRISKQRLIDGCRSGYDIITGSNSTGNIDRATNLPELSRTAWDVLLKNEAKV